MHPMLASQGGRKPSHAVEERPTRLRIRADLNIQNAVLHNIRRERAGFLLNDSAKHADSAEARKLPEQEREALTCCSFLHMTNPNGINLVQPRHNSCLIPSSLINTSPNLTLGIPTNDGPKHFDSLAPKGSV